MSLPRYPTYKDSGVEWLGEVPGHWDVWKLAHAFGVIGSGTTPSTDNRVYYDDGEFPWVNTGDLTDGVLDTCSRFVTAKAISDHSSLKVFPAGSLIIAMYGATIGKLAKLRFPATVNQACCVFSGKSAMRPEFLFYWFLAYREQIVSLATGGGQPNISQDTLRKLRAACPSDTEQAHITTFLDRETAKIDALVAEQQRLIELLKEKRQAVISHAVTKGLNPDAPMKDSGIEWLGDVPAHWEVRKLADMCDVLAGFSFSSSDFGLEGTPVIRMSDFGSGTVETDGAKRIDPQLVPNKSLAISGDVLLGLSGSITNFAVVREADLPIAINQRVAIVRSPAENQELLTFFLQTREFQEQITAEVPETTILNISMGQLRSCRVPLPPLGERSMIIRFVRDEVSKLDLLTTEAQRAIDLLQERRTALISAAVTGQIDVRPAAERAAA